MKTKKNVRINNMPRLKAYYDFVVSIVKWKEFSEREGISDFVPRMVSMKAQDKIADLTLCSEATILCGRYSEHADFQLAFENELADVNTVFDMDYISNDFEEIAIGFCVDSTDVRILVQINSIHHLLIFAKKNNWSLVLIEAYLNGDLNEKLEAFLGAEHPFCIKTNNLTRRKASEYLYSNL